MDFYNKPPPHEFLMHYGVKGMKWGVRRTPEQLGHPPKRAVEKSETPAIIRMTVSGHDTTPKHAAPMSIADHIGKDGRVDVRTFYDEDGWKAKDIHTTDHGHPKQHQTVPHVHEYTWYEDGTSAGRTMRDLTDQERKENEDIL